MTPSESLKLMQEASDKFYQASCHTQCHAFVEFTGLMNEYIKVCSEFQKANPEADFRTSNGHSEDEISLKPYQKQYIREKLHCIYQQNLIN
ncbi:MAG: hypothetical protein WCD53_16505 [Microcoleus sp.]